MAISGWSETSCISRFSAKRAFIASSGTGLPSAGLSSGGRGSGRLGMMFTHFRGIWRVGSW